MEKKDKAMANKDLPLGTVYKYLLKDYRAEQKKNKDLQTELGKEKAYSQELEARIRDLEVRISSNKEENKAVLREIKEQEAYQRLKKQMQDQGNHIRGLKQARDNALSQVVALAEEVRRLKNK